MTVRFIGANGKAINISVPVYSEKAAITAAEKQLPSDQKYYPSIIL